MSKKSKSLYPNVHPRNPDRLKKGIVQSCISAMTTLPRLSEKKLVVSLLGGFKTWCSVLIIPADVPSSDPSSVNSATSHPQTRLRLIHKLGYISSTTRLHLIHKLGYISSPNSALSHPQTRLHLIHDSATSHPHLGYISSIRCSRVARASDCQKHTNCYDISLYCIVYIPIEECLKIILTLFYRSAGTFSCNRSDVRQIKK